MCTIFNAFLKRKNNRKTLQGDFILLKSNASAKVHSIQNVLLTGLKKIRYKTVSQLFYVVINDVYI